jgi:hypothetical protein
MMMITSSVTMPPPMYITAPFVVAIRGLLLLPYPLSVNLDQMDFEGVHSERSAGGFISLGAK